MKRFAVSGRNRFARFAVKPHTVASGRVYRGGVRL